MQIASQTLREARGVASHLGHLCRAVILTLTILCFSISPNNREGPESSHCIHLKSMAFPRTGPYRPPHLHPIKADDQQDNRCADSLNRNLEF